MKSFLITLLFVGIAMAEIDNVNFIQRHKRDSTKMQAPGTCENNAKNCCADNGKCIENCSSLILDKSSRYDDFTKLTNENLIRSFEYLFLSAQFGTHMKDRPGFEKVLHGLADGAWNKGIEMIQETAKRGVAHNFEMVNANSKSVKANGNVNEVEALAKAVEIEKNLLIQANTVHRHHSHATLTDTNANGYDAGIAHFLAEEIIEGKTQTVRNLVGHVNDLKNIFKQGSTIFPMSLYLFDQYLQK